MALAVGKSNNENYALCEMIKEDNASNFIKAIEKEIHDHESRGQWYLIKRNKIPRDTKTIQAIWSFKRKRFPYGTLNNHKACLCAHGGMQQWGLKY